MSLRYHIVTHKIKAVVYLDGSEDSISSSIQRVNMINTGLCAWCEKPAGNGTVHLCDGCQLLTHRSCGEFVMQREPCVADRYFCLACLEID